MGAREDISLAIQFYKIPTENGIYPDLEEKIDNLEKILSHSNN